MAYLQPGVKAGTLVRVRQWDDMVREHGMVGNINVPYGFTAEMRELCGSWMVLEKATSMHNMVNIDRSRVGRGWSFSRQMFEPVYNNTEKSEVVDI